MKRSFMIAKLHGLRVTSSDLHYEGSIALDPDYCERVGLLPFEFVEIWNKATGARIQTYVLYGERGSRCCVLNGAAARTCQVGDELIIVARANANVDELDGLRPRVAVFGDGNELTSFDEYEYSRGDNGHWRIAKR